MTPIFDLSRVTKTFSGAFGRGAVTTAIEEVSLTAIGGERLALLGPNGSGKSTLLRLLAGLLSAQGGSVRALGGVPAQDPSIRRRLGLCTGDERSLLLRLTPRENLRFFGALYGLGGDDLRRRIETLAAELGLQAQLDRPTYTLSSGNRARLLLGRALIHGPDLILLDESTHALDPEGVERLHGLLRARTEAGACVVFVTHNAKEAEALATRKVRLDHGRVVEDAPGGARSLRPEEDRASAKGHPVSALALMLAWIRKATLEELSYRGYLVLEAVGGLVTLLGLYYFSRLVGSSQAGLIGPEGYFAFACVGLAAYLPARTAQAELARQVRAAQLVGLLEPLAAAPPSLPAQLLAMAVQPTLGALFRGALTLLCGCLLFGLRLQATGLGALLAALVLAAVASAGLGLCSAAVVLHVRRSDPVAYLLDAAAWLGSGLVFPVALLPGWAQTASDWLPATHAVGLARALLLPGRSPFAVGTELGALAALATLAVALGWASLSLAIRAARRSGALGIS